MNGFSILFYMGFNFRYFGKSGENSLTFQITKTSVYFLFCKQLQLNCIIFVDLLGILGNIRHFL